jgi:hypothetical protein
VALDVLDLERVHQFGCSQVCCSLRVSYGVSRLGP